MSDIKLFKTTNSSVEEIPGDSVKFERVLQTLIEGNLEAFLGVRFLASEFVTNGTTGGRMDTLGIDENNCPIIIEYKRTSNENVINQGLFYLDWLVTHRGDFERLVQRKFGSEVAELVEWSSPRLICIAGDFSRYDEHAIKQIDRNIELVRYVRFGTDLLMLEQVNSNWVTSNTRTIADTPGPTETKRLYTHVSDHLEKADADLTQLYESLREFALNLGEDVQEKTLKFYIAFKRLKNFASVEIHTKKRQLLVCLNYNPDIADLTYVDLNDGFARDVRQIGHLGTGDLELTIRSMEDLERAKPLIEQSYHNS